MKRIYTHLTLVIILLLTIGCSSSILPPITPPDNDGNGEEVVGPSAGSIIIAGGAENTKDCTPELTISSEGAAYMSFSGDGNTWTDWIEYSTSYDKFNMANNLYGTVLSSGTKKVYVRFKDEEENLSPEDQLAFDDIEYEISVLKYLVVEPDGITLKVRQTQVFTVMGMDKEFNEVPLDGGKVTWNACCNAYVSPATGLSVTYTAPSGPGNKYIQAVYGNFKDSAYITVTY
jgi:hypothetical protein